MSCNEWREVRLDEIIEFNPKESIPKGTLAKKISMDMINPFYKYVNEYEIEEYKGGSKFKNGDTLMARITPCLENGKTVKVTILGKNEVGFGSTEFIVLRAKEGLTIEDYVYYTAISPNVRDIAIKSMTGTSGRQRAQVNVIQNIQINLPPLNEQKAIAKILSDLDEKIEINNRINKVLEEIAQAIFKRWFVEFEFPNENEEPYKSSGGEMVESELGLIPKGWEVGRLGEVLETSLGGTPKREIREYWENGAIPWCNSAKANDFRIIEPTEYITEKGLKESSTKLLPKRTTVIAITGATLGKISLLEIDSCTNQSLVGILENKLYKAEFIYPLMKIKIKELINLQTGGAQQHINKDNINKLKIILPKKELLEKYYGITEKIFKQISLRIFEVKNLMEIRDTLLPKLMSGEIRVDLNNGQIVLKNED